MSLSKLLSHHLSFSCYPRQRRPYPTFLPCRFLIQPRLHQIYKNSKTKSYYDMSIKINGKRKHVLYDCITNKKSYLYRRFRNDLFIGLHKIYHFLGFRFPWRTLTNITKIKTTNDCVNRSLINFVNRFSKFVFWKGTWP